MLRVGFLIILSTAGSCAAAATVSEQAGWREVVRQFASQHFRNPAWGYSHSVRDYALARDLAAADHATVDDDVLFAAAYLHDMAAFAPWDREKEGIDHADEGARVVDTVLKGTGFPSAKIEAVRGAIRTHMFDRSPVGPEALYLHDADALDWLGAIGAARVIALVDPNGGEPDGPKAVKMLEDNLAQVPSRVLSPAGKKRMPQLQQELAEFLKGLRRETDDYRML
jgi:HD superfamily phosphodiesterase